MMEIIEEETSHERYGICPRCGHKINFCGAGYMGLFECDCGQWYNIFGQALKLEGVLMNMNWDDDLDEKAAAFFAATGRTWDAGTPDKSRRSDKHATETEGTSMTECDCVLWYNVFGQYIDS